MLCILNHYVIKKMGMLTCIWFIESKR